MESKQNHKKPYPKKPEGRDNTFRKPPLLSAKRGSLIAVTGGIGSGKSFVLECFSKLGFEVFSADKAIHEMLKKDGKAFDPVSKLFPKAVTAEGIDRKLVSEEVFKDPAKLQLLENILHPLVRQTQVEFVVNIKNNSGKSVVFEVPLLFENKREKNYDFIVACIVPKDIQKKRVLSRKNMTEEKFNAIIGRQVSDSVRFKGAHIIIKTGRLPVDTIKQVKAAIFNDSYKRTTGNSPGYGNHRTLREKR